MNSFSRALGQVVRLMTRNLYKCLEPAYSLGWGSLTSLTDSAREELVFWEANLRKLNGFAISPVTPSIASCEIVAGMHLAVDCMQPSFLVQTRLFILES